jgi:hypothetical protein
MSPKKILKKIRKRHSFFKEYFNAKPTWKADISVQDVDYLLARIEVLESRLKG